MWAIHKHEIEIALLLLENAAKAREQGSLSLVLKPRQVRVRDFDGRTALHMAAMEGEVKQGKTGGASDDVEGSSGSSPQCQESQPGRSRQLR